MPDYLPTVPRLVLICVLAVVGLVVAPLFEVAAWLRNRRRWEGDEPRGVVCPHCDTNHPGDLVCRTSVASFMREEAAAIGNVSLTESPDYLRGYAEALHEYADMIGGSDGR